MKQTAVEWLIEQLEWDYSKIARVIGLKKYNQVVSQAKEMEKQQIIDAHTKSYLIGEDSISKQDADIASCKYFKETFKK